MATNNGNHTEWILETIDHLRRRKARPDMERICHVVRRRYGLSSAETEAKLEKLVDAEIVIKVDYKGDTSYRNAAKWRKSMLGCAVMNSTTISIKVIEAILELSKQAVTRNKTESEIIDVSGRAEQCEKEAAERAMTIGATLEKISAWLLQNCDGFNQLKSPLTVILKREIDAGRIKRPWNTNYVITPEQMKEINNGIVRPLRSNRKSDAKPVGLATPTPQQPANNNDEAVNNNNNKDIVSNNTSVTAPSNPNGLSGTGTSVVVTDTNQKSTHGSQHGHQAVTQQPARRGRPPKYRPPPASVPTATTQSSSGTPSTLTSGTPSKLKRILSSGAEVSSSGSPDRKQAKRSMSQVQGETLCDFCHLSSFKNKQGEPELLLCCKDCTAKAHPSCMKYSPLLASRAYKYPWQCMDCKTCCVCQDAGDPDLMLFCDGCDKGYHTSCHQPEVTKKPSGLWQCSSCKLENVAVQRTEFMSNYGFRHLYATGSAPPTPAESPVSMTNGHAPIPTSPVYSPDGVYPDASGWSVDDVVSFISSAGFEEQAKVFKEQEIDGVALLLLKRADVLKGLELKLGPALKINRHIQGLQAAKEAALL